MKKIKKNLFNLNNLIPKFKYFKRKSRLLKTRLIRIKPNCHSSKPKSHKSPTVTRMSRPLVNDLRNLLKNAKRLTALFHQLPTKNLTRQMPPKMSMKNSIVKQNGCNANSRWWKKLLWTTRKWDKRISTQFWHKIPNSLRNAID